MSSADNQEMVPIPAPDGEPLQLPDYATACLLQGILAGCGIEAAVPGDDPRAAAGATAAERAGETAGDRPPEDYEPESAAAELERANPARVKIL